MVKLARFGQMYITEVNLMASKVNRTLQNAGNYLQHTYSITKQS